MSASKKSGRSRTERAGKPSPRKSTPKSGSKVTPRHGTVSGSLPDLTAIFYAFCDAQALVAVAHMVIVEGNNYGPEETVLRLGVAAPDRISDQLEQAEMQLGRFRSKKASAQQGGAS